MNEPAGYLRILVLGASGMLGRCLADTLRSRGHQVWAPARSDLDLSDRRALKSYLARPFDGVFNAAAYTAVDDAEDQVKKAFLLNAEVPRLLAECCQASGTPLIHYSTDYVFDGSADRPYEVYDPKNPASVYGQSKAEGEEAVLEYGHSVIRTSWLFAPWGRNFVITMLRLMAERQQVLVVRDQKGRPSYVPDVVDGSLHIWKHLQQNAASSSNIFHVCNHSETNWFEFASAIHRIATDQGRVLRCREIQPIATLEYPTRAQRPAYSVLSTSMIESIGYQPRAWGDALVECMQVMPKRG